MKFEFFKKRGTNWHIIPIFILIFISCITYWRWFSFDYFVYADNSLQYLQTAEENLIPKLWLSDHSLGHTELTIWNSPVRVIKFFVSTATNSDSNVSEKFIFLWPIIFLLPLSSYILLYYILKSKFAAFMGSLIMCFNSYFLAIISQGHLSLVLSCIFSNFSLFYLLKSINEGKKSAAIVSGLTLFVSASYDLRIAYIAVWIFSLYWVYLLIYNLYKKRTQEIYLSFRSIFICFSIVGVLSLFWIIPQLQQQNLLSNEILNRDIVFRDYWGILHAIALYHPFFESLPTWFNVTYPNLNYYILPLLALLGIIVAKNNKHYILFFTLILVIGILLVKQNGAPFESLYDFLYTHIPGFNGFREATKFFYLIILSYSVLIGSFFLWLWNNVYTNTQKYSVFCFTALVIALQIYPLLGIINGNKESLYIPTKNDSLEINKYLTNFFDENAEGYKILFVPTYSKWSMQSIAYPRISMTRTIEDQWIFIPEYTKVKDYPYVDILMQDFSSTLLENNSIKYVVIPNVSKEGFSNDFSVYFKKNREFYVETLDKLDYLKQIDIGMNQVNVYELQNPLPRFYLSSDRPSLEESPKSIFVEYEQVSSVEYILKLNSISTTTYLQFTDSYNPNWYIKIGNDIVQLKSIFWGNYYLDESFHIKNQLNQNTFIIDPLKIKRLSNTDEIQSNKDGSINFEVVVYYKPQSYFYLGSIISLLSLFLIIFAYLYTKRYEK